MIAFSTRKTIFDLELIRHLSTWILKLKSVLRLWLIVAAYLPLSVAQESYVASCKQEQITQEFSIDGAAFQLRPVPYKL